MCDSDPLAEYAQEEEPEVDLMQRAQVKQISSLGISRFFILKFAWANPQAGNLSIFVPFTFDGLMMWTRV